MPSKVTINPGQIVINDGSSFLVTASGCVAKTSEGQKTPVVKELNYADTPKI